MKTQKRLKVEYSDTCPTCSRKIIGTSEDQVKYNMKVHCMQKHNLLINIKQLPKNQSKEQIKYEVNK